MVAIRRGLALPFKYVAEHVFPEHARATVFHPICKIAVLQHIVLRQCMISLPLGTLAMSKPQKPRKCIFCGSSRLSREHFWPVWASKLLNVTGDARTVATYDHALGTAVLVREDKRPGHLKSIRIKCVCAKCNNEWMGSIEESAKDCLTKLATGASYTLSEIDKSNVATWVALKVIIGEHNDAAKAVSRQTDRSLFRENRIPPNGFRILIAACGDARLETVFAKTASKVMTRRPTINELDTGLPYNIQCTSFGFGRLFVHAIYTTTDADLQPIFNEAGIVYTLWPLSEEPITWPPKRSITYDEAASIARTLLDIDKRPDVTRVFKV